MMICDICGSKNDILLEKYELPTDYTDGVMTFKKLDICYACKINLTERANFAKLKYIKEKITEGEQ